MGYTRRQIVLENLTLPVSIGIHDAERQAAQPVAISLTLDLSPADPPSRDCIGEVLDYDGLRDGIRALTRDRHFDLQETLADAIVTFCLGFEAVCRIEVALRKTTIYPDCDGVGVTLVYQR